MAEIFAETTLPFSEEAGIYAFATSSPVRLFQLEEGANYEVVWDGVSYQVESKNFVIGEVPLLYLGNAAIAGMGDDTDEPFLLAEVEGESTYTYYMYTIETDATHTIAINSIDVTPEEPEEPDGIVLKDHAGNDILHEGIKSIRVRTADGGTKSFIAGKIAEKTVDLAMAAGDQVIEAGENTVLGKVTVKKPDTLIPENIAKGVEIGGVVGTASGGGGLYKAADPEWLEKVVFWDYDGTIVLMLSLEEANALTELPTPPAHEGLVFQGWNFTLEEIKNVTHVLDIGAIYVPEDGKTHVKINISNSSYKTIPVNFSQTKSSGVTIDWGDGTVETISGTGIVTKSHAYASIGEYEITFDVADGCEMVLGGGTAATTFVTKNQSYYYNYVQEIYIGNNVTGLATYAFFAYQSMNVLTIPEGVKSIGNNGFYQLYTLPALLLPRSTDSLGSQAMYYAGYFTCKIVVSVPTSVMEIGTYAFAYSCFTRIILPDSITVLSTGIAQYGYMLRLFIMGDNVHTINDYAFYYCYKLKEVKFSKSLTSIGARCFYRSGIENLVLPEGITSLPSYFVSDAHCLRDVVLPDTLTSIGDNFGYNCYSLRKVVVPKNVKSIGTYFCYSANSLETVIIKGNPTIGSTFLSSIYSLVEVVLMADEPVSAAASSLVLYGFLYVPDELVESYKTICTRTPTMYNIKPLSSYPVEL